MIIYIKLNIMVKFLVWSFICYGLSNILVYGSIFNSPRNYIRSQSENDNNILRGAFEFVRDMLSCMMCTPVWVGFFLSFVVYSPSMDLLSVDIWRAWFFDGMISSGVVWSIYTILEWFESNIKQN